MSKTWEYSFNNHVHRLSLASQCVCVCIRYLIKEITNIFTINQNISKPNPLAVLKILIKMLE